MHLLKVAQVHQAGASFRQGCVQAHEVANAIHNLQPLTPCLQASLRVNKGHSLQSGKEYLSV